LNFNNFLVNRFLKNKNNKYSMISVFGVLGVLIGVFAIISVISIMRGFQNKLIDRIIGTQAHVYINSESNFLNDHEKIIKNINSKNIEVISPYVETETIIYFDDKTIGAVLFSSDKSFFKTLKLPGIKNREVVLGQQLALENEILNFQKIEILSSWDLAKNKVPKLRKFEVKDTFRTGNYFRDLKYIYVNIKDASKYFMPFSGLVSGLSIISKEPKNVDKLKSELKEQLKTYKNLKVKTWKDVNKKLLFSLTLERYAMLIALFLIVLVSIFSIIVSVALMVESKKKDFAILSSMGLSKKSIYKSVILISLIKGSFGAVLGGVFATLFSYLLKYYEIISLPSIYYDTKLPIFIDLKFNFAIVFLAIIMCVLGSIYPLLELKKISISEQIKKF
jgi:ABC-type lipoprotein release transport system permease subunit